MSRMYALHRISNLAVALLVLLMVLEIRSATALAQLRLEDELPLDLPGLLAQEADREGWAIAFNGRDTTITLPGIPFHEYPALTIEVWVRGWQGPILWQGDPAAMAESGRADANLWMSLGPESHGPSAGCGWRSETGVDFPLHAGRGNPVRWNHLALVYGDGGKRLFLNGSLVGSIQGPAPAPVDSPTSLVLGWNPLGGVEHVPVEYTPFDHDAVEHAPGGPVPAEYIPIGYIPNQHGSGMMGPIRVSRVARYEADFEPTWQFERDDATVMLLSFDGGQGLQLQDQVNPDLPVVMQGGSWLAAAELYALDLNGYQVTDQDLQYLDGLQSLRRLEFMETRVTDDGLAHLISLRNLELLNLTRLPITDRGLEQIRNLQALRELQLGGTEITDAGLRHVGSLANLRTLSMESTWITDEGLEQLAGLAKLEKLVLSETKINGCGLQALEKADELKELHLWKTDVTNEQLEFLQHFPALEAVALGDTRITDEGLAQLNHLKTLKILDLSSAKITGSGLQQLQDLQAIRDISLAGTAVDDTTLKFVAGFSGLERLYLGRTRISDAGLQHLQHLTNLRVLHLDDNTLNGSGLTHLRSAMDLRELKLCNTETDDDALALVAEHMRLQCLNFANTEITDVGMQHLSKLAMLEELYLSGSRVTDQGVAEIQDVTRIELLGVNRLPGVSDDGLAYLGRLRRLRNLWIRDTAVSPAAADLVKQFAPQCTVDAYQGSGIVIFNRRLADIEHDLKSTDDKIRIHAVRCLGDNAVSSLEARRRLLQLVDAPEQAMQIGAMDAIGRLGHQFPEAKDKLLLKLRSQKRLISEYAAITVVKVLTPPESIVDDLLQLLEDPKTRRCAIRGLSALETRAEMAADAIRDRVAKINDLSFDDRIRLLELLTRLDPVDQTLKIGMTKSAKFQKIALHAHTLGEIVSSADGRWLVEVHDPWPTYPGEPTGRIVTAWDMYKLRPGSAMPSRKLVEFEASGQLLLRTMAGGQWVLAAVAPEPPRLTAEIYLIDLVGEVPQTVRLPNGLLTVSADRSKLAVKKENEIVVLNVREKDPLASKLTIALESESDARAEVVPMKFSPTGRWLVSGNWVLDLESLDVWKSRTPLSGIEDAEQPSWGPDSDRLLFGPGDRWLLRVNRKSNDATHEAFPAIGPGRKAPQKLDGPPPSQRVPGSEQWQFCPTSNWLLAAAVDQDVRLWDLHSEKARLQILNGYQRATFSPDGRWLLAAGHRKLTAWRFDGQNGPFDEVELPIQWDAVEFGNDSFRWMRFSEDGKWTIIATQKGQIWTTRLDTGSPDESLRRIPVTTTGGCVSPGGRWLATTKRISIDERKRNLIALWDLTNVTRDPAVLPDQSGGANHPVGFNSDGSWLLTNEGGGAWGVWDLRTLNDAEPGN